MAEATIQVLGPAPTLIPIYCTAEIPPEVSYVLLFPTKLHDILTRTLSHQLIDTLITRNFVYSIPSLYLVDDAHRATDAFDTCTFAKPPTAPFTSPFLNHTLGQLREHFMSFPDIGHFFSTFTFIVLDERSIRDETCLIVTTIPGYGSDKDLETARADFYIAVQVLIPVEMRSHRLTEMFNDTWRDDDGQVLFTKERMAEMMGKDWKSKDALPRYIADGKTEAWPARVEDL
jgi:hypothetical protein